MGSVLRAQDFGLKLFQRFQKSGDPKGLKRADDKGVLMCLTLDLQGTPPYWSIYLVFCENGHEFRYFGLPGIMFDWARCVLFCSRRLQCEGECLFQGFENLTAWALTRYFHLGFGLCDARFRPLLCRPSLGLVGVHSWQ